MKIEHQNVDEQELINKGYAKWGGSYYTIELIQNQLKELGVDVHIVDIDNHYLYYKFDKNKVT